MVIDKEIFKKMPKELQILFIENVDEVEEIFPETKSGAMNGNYQTRKNNIYKGFSNKPVPHKIEKSEGSASRFFYCAKASKKERGDNNHPTVKPVELMRYLVRLVTPTGGTVLDPYMGSGTTGIACKKEGFDFIGIERELEYLDIAKQRIESTIVRAKLF